MSETTWNNSTASGGDAPFLTLDTIMEQIEKIKQPIDYSSMPTFPSQNGGYLFDGQFASPLYGIELHASEYVPKSTTIQVRFPRSKKKRIRKKWAKDRRNWKTVDVVYLAKIGNRQMLIASKNMQRAIEQSFFNEISKESRP